MINITIFKNRYDNKTHRRLDLKSFDELEQLLYGLSLKSLKGKEDAYLISPATYVEDGTRRNDNVLHWSHWCAVDVDDLHIESDIQEYINDMFPTWRFICYSTASSTIEQPKFRIVFALSRNILADEIVPFWHALQMAIGEIGDEQTKDKSRMYYIPGNYKDANNFIFEGKTATCMVNPRAGKETRFNWKRAQKKKKLAVVGCGPAGMAAASILAERGHLVTVF